MLDRPGVPQCIMRVRWEHVEEAPVSETFSFNSIPREAGDVASEWTMFYNSIAEGTSTTCGCKVVDASLGSNPRTRSQTPERKKTIKQKKEACGTPEPAERYWQASQSRALAVTVGRSGAVLLNWHAGKGGVSLFPWWFQGCPPTIGGSHFSASPEKSMPEYWRGEMVPFSRTSDSRGTLWFSIVDLEKVFNYVLWGGA